MLCDLSDPLDLSKSHFLYVPDRNCNTHLSQLLRAMVKWDNICSGALGPGRLYTDEILLLNKYCLLINWLEKSLINLLAGKLTSHYPFVFASLSSSFSLSLPLPHSLSLSHTHTYSPLSALPIHMLTYSLLRNPHSCFQDFSQEAGFLWG